jgi:hypothetical protein
MAQVEPAGVKRKDAAIILDVHPGTIDNMVEAGTLQVYHIGVHGRGKRITRESIDKVLNGKKGR